VRRQEGYGRGSKDSLGIEEELKISTLILGCKTEYWTERLNAGLKD
jgi:hypothetical protein